MTAKMSSVIVAATFRATRAKTTSNCSGRGWTAGLAAYQTQF